MYTTADKIFTINAQTHHFHAAPAKKMLGKNGLGSGADGVYLILLHTQSV
jgi:hypothetical protein